MDITDYTLSPGNTFTFSAYLTERQNSKLILTGNHIQPDIRIINPLGLEEPYELLQSKPESTDSDLLYSFDVNFSPSSEGSYKVTITGQEEEDGTTINHGFFGSVSNTGRVQNIVLGEMLSVAILWTVFSLLVIAVVKLSRKIESKLHIFPRTKKSLFSKDSLQNKNKTWAVVLALIFGIFQIHGIGHFYIKKYFSGGLFLLAGFLPVILYYYSYIPFYIQSLSYHDQPLPTQYGSHSSPTIFSIPSLIDYLSRDGSYFVMLFLTIYLMQILHICYFTKNQKTFFRIRRIVVMSLLVGIIFTVYPGYGAVYSFIQDVIPGITLANHHDTVIKMKSHAGFCTGYCSMEIIMTFEKISYSSTGYTGNPPLELPEITNEIPMSETQWQKVLSTINFPLFLLLPDRIGSPGAFDARVYTIEISMIGLTKSISFEKSDYIPQISDLRTELDEISKMMIPR